MVDRVEEDENEIEKTLEITTGPPIPILLGLCLAHILPPRRALGHILQRLHRIRLLPPTIPEIAGGNENPNAVADIIAERRHEETNNQKI